MKTRVEFDSALDELAVFAKDAGYDLVITPRVHPQNGMSASVNIVRGDKTVTDLELCRMYLVLHRYWETLGGDPLVEWDLGRFQAGG